jgi:endonuclease III
MSFANVFPLLEHSFTLQQAPVIDLLKVNGADHFKILVATLLSSRTQDKTTTKAVGKLFAKIKNPTDLAKLPVSHIEKLIYPVGFYKVKARHLKELVKSLGQNFRGKVPETREELMTLPGVGRKTANLVLAVAFEQPAICVDTHVHRISNRLGWVKTKTPLETEQALM